MNAGFPPPCTFSQVLNELLTSLIYLSGTYREHNVREAHQTATRGSFLSRSVFQTLPCEHARGSSVQKNGGRQGWQQKRQLQIVYPNPLKAWFAPYSPSKRREKAASSIAEEDRDKGENDSRQKSVKQKKRNTASEIHTDINNIWLKHVRRQKKNDGTEDKDEKEHHENTITAMMIPALM